MLNRKCFLLIFAAVIYLTSSVHAAEKRPNILFIFTDDHASHSISAYGSKINKTPNLDRIANEGMLFKNCFCTNSICGPSRAVIQTGKYSHINGFLTNGNKFDGKQQTFPKLLKKSGYETAVIGKWHLGEHMPPQGYSYSEVLIGQGPYYNPPMLRDENGNGDRNRINYTGYTTDIITDLALEWLKNSRDEEKPFMLMYQHKAPHREWAPGPDYLHMYDDVEIPEPPHLFDDYETRGRAAHEQDMSIAKTMTPRDLKLTPPPYLNEEQLKVWNAAYEPKNEAFRKLNLKGDDLIRWKYQRYIKDYLRCIASVDDNIGRVLEYLDESGLAENTIVIYSSDQGFYLGDHGWFDKRFMYEESYRQPLLVRWPNVVKAGSRDEHLVSNVDFAETFLDIAGVAVPDDMQGQSLVPLLKGEKPKDWRKSHYYHYYEFQNDRRTAHMVRRHYGVRTDRYKLIHFYNVDEWELFDLEADPLEMTNIYSEPQYQTLVKELKAETIRLQEELKVPDDTGSVDAFPPSIKLKQNQPRRNQKQQPKKKQ
ncbi:MAG: sulfatase [Planctomicrobium sp.]|jgi:arylsulfatase A-like enzyme|nr:sulfatase [Planctomicrobium sp.]